MTPKDAKFQRIKRALDQRTAQRACAADFLRHGDEVGIHAKRCVFGKADSCRREYDPCPVPEATPDPTEYRGTGIGSVYGMNGDTDPHAWQLAGWNITRRRRRKQ